jgi:hypothetical protein
MYLYYEHHRDGTGKIVLTELCLSSHKNGKLAISFFLATEKLVFEMLKPVLKAAPVSARSYEPNSNIWTYMPPYGEQTIEQLVKVAKCYYGLDCIEVEDLAAQAVNHQVDLSGKRKQMRAEEFFYNHGVSAARPPMSKAELTTKLISLIGVNIIDKHTYRAAALRYHPDRNNGDGSKMSELNMLWQLYHSKENPNEQHPSSL